MFPTLFLPLKFSQRIAFLQGMYSPLNGPVKIHELHQLVFLRISQHFPVLFVISIGLYFNPNFFWICKTSHWVAGVVSLGKKVLCAKTYMLQF